MSRKTVAASLRRQGLAGISPRRFAPATTIIDLNAVLPKDLVNRRFDAGEQLARFARKHHLVRSVGRTGVCWDNAAAESFWATLKVEFYNRYLWPTKAAAKLAVGDWIERVYNRRRRHSAIGIIQPAEYENWITQTAQAA